MKHYSKVEFGHKTPSLSELVKVLPYILDRKSVERDNSGRRLVFRFPDNKEIDRALEEASWFLNDGGMKRFFSELKSAECKKKNIVVNENKLTETYTGRKTCNYLVTMNLMELNAIALGFITGYFVDIYLSIECFTI